MVQLIESGVDSSGVVFYLIMEVHPHSLHTAFSYLSRPSQGSSRFFPEYSTFAPRVFSVSSQRIPFCLSSESVSAYLCCVQDLGDQSLDKILKEKGNLSGTRNTSP